MREKGLWATEAGIKLDGQAVGSVSIDCWMSALPSEADMKSGSSGRSDC